VKLLQRASESQGWQASIALGFAERSGRTVLVSRRHRGPLAVQRPFYPEGPPCHVYLLHPPGGVVGGDRLDIAVEVADGAHALVTTPGAAKLYRSAGPRAWQTQALLVAAGGILEWLPQENILFPGANAALSTRVDLEPGARFIGWEIHSLGRPAIGERFTAGVADLSLEIRRARVPLMLDRLRLNDGVGLDGPAGLRGFPVTGTLLATGAGPQDLAAVRAQCAADSRALWGATLLGDLLVARCLAPGTEPARRLFVAIWGTLRPSLLGCPACPPRIWGT
jgi:urease accessory protein